MKFNLLILATQAFLAYFLVLWTHSLRKRFGLTFLYALLGGLTVIMSLVTDAGAAIEIFGITFMIGSTVFYTSLLLGVFVLYIFDGPVVARVAIFTIVFMSILTPLVSALVHYQVSLSGSDALLLIPKPTFRINLASVVTTALDLIFLAIIWELSGKKQLHLKLWKRAFFTLLEVMWFDVLLFTTGAFWGTPFFLSILKGNLASRFVISLFAFPALYFYISWQNKKYGNKLENRPILSILKEDSDVRSELNSAKQEIKLRKKTELEKEALIKKLTAALTKVNKLEGLIPVCSSCRRVRIEPEQKDQKSSWVSMENYISQETTAQISHGICPECAKIMYPEITEELE